MQHNCWGICKSYFEMKELLAMCVQGTRMNGMYNIIADNGVTALALPWIKQHFAG